MKSTIPPLIAPRVTIAKGQEEYVPIVAALVTHPGYKTNVVELNGERFPMNTHLFAFMPSPDELALMRAGEPLYVGMLTFGYAVTPLLVQVGTKVAAETYTLEVDP